MKLVSDLGKAVTNSKEKARLRSSMRRRLAGVKGEVASRVSQAVQERVLALTEVVDARRLLVCLSFGVEIETRGLIDQLHSQGKEVLLPRIDVGNPSMALYRWPCPLERLPFGLQQPAPATASGSAMVDPGEPVDVALILGLAFDRGLFRLGHGGGYFDRWLDGRSTLPIGLAYDAQIIDNLPRERHDIPMEIVVTDAAVYRSKSNNRDEEKDMGDQEGLYSVVINHEEQYSIWPEDRKVPLGWQKVGKPGTKREMHAYLEEIQADRKPLRRD